MSNTLDESFKRPGSVPFKWEIQPGTPKRQLHETTTSKPSAMLSPPPAFFSRSLSLPPSDRRRRMDLVIPGTVAVSIPCKAYSGCFYIPTMKKKDEYHKNKKREANKAYGRSSSKQSSMSCIQSSPVVCPSVKRAMRVDDETKLADRWLF
ncbi:hypothetical protein QJS04_geneDACA001862 [Acorus gramineus]|uniref:Uncharacterized protein n=1 Tax=Acorus gramineus TaxID=55184 RepID=A0AAV9BGP1_ACOGR|nr:hypothetical protein QJS04_geneDACA001862 [Acorus gramineus]